MVVVVKVMEVIETMMLTVNEVVTVKKVKVVMMKVMVQVRVVKVIFKVVVMVGGVLSTTLICVGYDDDNGGRAESTGCGRGRERKTPPWRPIKPLHSLIHPNHSLHSTPFTHSHPSLTLGRRSRSRSPPRSMRRCPRWAASRASPAAAISPRARASLLARAEETPRGKTRCPCF